VKGFRKAMTDAEAEDEKEKQRLEEPDAEFAEAHSEEKPADQKQAS
jgi:Sec-independent protein translocase protein TatA